MTKIKDVFFGGAEKKAAKKQASALKTSQSLVREGTESAKSDVLGLFPEAQRSRQLGFQGALDVFGKTIPQQLGAFQGGNVAAQQQIAAGLPQIQAAILGQPVDFSAFQPQALGFDAGFAQQQLPQFTAAAQAPDPTITSGAGGPLVGPADRGDAIARLISQFRQRGLP